jgi:glycosyltransferase involved in cell wall biosynthesis
MNSAFFSVIIPCYKMGRFIGAALDSVATQTCSDWEVIVVDDSGPLDGTQETVEAFSARFPEKRIEYIRHATNQGVSAARNTAITAARTEWLAFLDPDDLWLSNHLESARRVITANPEVELVTSTCEVFHDDEPTRKPGVWRPPGWKLRHFPASLAVANFIQPCATLTSRKAVLSVGGFDTAPELQHIEDWDLWLRLAKAGKKFHFQDHVTSRYRRHTAQATHDPSAVDKVHDAFIVRHQVYIIRQQSLMIHKAFFEMDSPRQYVKKALLSIRRSIRRIFTSPFG